MISFFYAQRVTIQLRCNMATYKFTFRLLFIIATTYAKWSRCMHTRSALQDENQHPAAIQIAH